MNTPYNLYTCTNLNFLPPYRLPNLYTCTHALKSVQVGRGGKKENLNGNLYENFFQEP